MGLDEQFTEAEQWVAHSMQLHQVRCSTHIPLPLSTASTQTTAKRLRQRHTGSSMLAVS